MAKWQIDTWRVKPSGFLASWRERAVFTDDDGNVTSECVPGKECMNLPCISDYSKNNRKHNPGDLITTYCNVTTHSKWSIYAQDCAPFAYAEEALDVPECGYLQPLPAPSVPSNPFGTIAYGLYAFYNYCDKDNVTGVVNIYRKDYSGTPIQIESGSESPVIIKYKDTDKKFEPIMSLECILTFIATANFQLSYLYAGDQREFKVIVEKASQVKFAGFIIPDSCSEPFAQPSYPVTIRATDGIGALQKVTYPMPYSASADLRQRWIDILAYALSLTNLELNIRTAVNLYDPKMANGIDDDPLAQSTVNPLRFTDGNAIDNAYDVLVKLCNQFTATLEQVDGEWQFVRKPELVQEFVRTRLYMYTGFFIRGEQLKNIRQAGVALTSDITFITEATPQLSIGDAFKKVVVRLDYGTTSALIQNGDFQQWNGVNFEHWAKHGGIQVDRYQKTITGAGGGSIPVDDYALLFLQQFAPGKYMQSSPIEVFSGNEIKMTFDVGYTSGPSILRFRIKVGQYYLVEEHLVTDPHLLQSLPPMTEDGRVDQNQIRYKWVTQDAIMFANPYTKIYALEKTYAHVYLDNPQMDIPGRFRTLSIQMPAVPVVDQMIVQVFGFHNQKTAFPSGGIAIDNIKMAVTAGDSESVSKGVFYFSEQLGFYTETPDEIPIVFGEYNATAKPRPARVQGGINTDLYAIYTADGSNATGWKTFGESGAYTPIGVAASRAIIKAHQKPYIFYSGVLAGSDFSHMNVFRMIVECDAGFSEKVFMQLGVAYDLVKNVISGTWVEIFSKPIFTNDGVVDNYPGTKLEVQPQDPTQLPALLGEGIFTPEFTEQFV